MSQRMTLISSPCFVPEIRLERIDSLQELFERPQPLSLEIGCGVGDFAIAGASVRVDELVEGGSPSNS